MNKRIFCSLTLALAFSAFPFQPVRAHGEPIIVVEPFVVPIGGQITVTGSEMEPGEVFLITLEGLAGSISLGEVTASGEGEEGGFVAQFTLALDITPGSYTLTATTEDGDSATSDLEITAASENASSAPAEMQEPTGEQHVLDRSKSSIEIIGVVLPIALSVAGGAVLIRSRD